MKIGRVNYNLGIFPRRFWWHTWTPKWHQGRGRYISIGLYIIAFYRGFKGDIMKTKKVLTPKQAEELVEQEKLK